MDVRTGLPVVGMVGGGQLARMTHQAAIAMGQSLRVFAGSQDDPAALVARDVVIGSHTDLAALRSFAAGVDVLTFDHEHVPVAHLRELVAEKVVVHPGPDALLFAQDKLRMRHRLGTAGFPVPPFAPVSGVDDVLGFGAEHGWPVVLKAVRGGYDGRGVWLLESQEHASELLPELLESVELMVEQRVRMRRELAALVARSPFGQGGAWPVVQTVQVGGICVEVLAPAPGLDAGIDEAATELALRVADELGVVGLLAVELFETDDGVLVNELALRPHNSGHWTIEGSTTSQFTQHLRAVMDYPLGATGLVAPNVAMVNVLGAAQRPAMGVDERLHHLFARFPEAHVHWYGKAERPGRKVGHVTLLGEDAVRIRQRAGLAAHWLSAASWQDGYSIHQTR
ncbi:MAG: 5-(carboxyamino)imidazole ribonucleotide synthase [Sciscionella sp.]